MLRANLNVDLTIIDEAHHLRNPNTATHTMGTVLSDLSESMLLLTATPVQLRSEDLFYLLKILDETTFNDVDEFDQVLEPNSFINIGGYCGERSMVDTAARIGSAARLGADCHLSAGAGLGGILEPVGSRPTIIEDGCFIGALSEVVEGVIVRKGSVVSMGCYIGKSTKIVNRETGEITSGEVPAGSVVVPGSLPSKKPNGPNLYCVVIIKTVDEKTRSKTSLNDLLRD